MSACTSEYAVIIILTIVLCVSHLASRPLGVFSQEAKFPLSQDRFKPDLLLAGVDVTSCLSDVTTGCFDGVTTGLTSSMGKYIVLDG